MKLPRDLSGLDLVEALRRDWGYVKVNQVGSHIVLETREPAAHRVVVPAHRVLKVGTLNAILRAVSEHKGVDKQAILDSL